MIKLKLLATIECDRVGCNESIKYESGASLSHAENNIRKLAKYEGWTQHGTGFMWFCPKHQD